MFRENENGFTLVELMIVVVIIGVLASIAIPKFSAIITRAKISEAKSILNQIIDLEQTYYNMYSAYVAFNEGQDAPQVDFTQPSPAKRRFEYKFEIVGAAPFDQSLATATENQDINGDGDTDDGLTLSVSEVQDVVNDMSW